MKGEFFFNQSTIGVGVSITQHEKYKTNEESKAIIVYFLSVKCQE